MRLTRALPSGLHVTWKRLAARAAIPWHDHGMATLCVVIGGGAEEEDARGTRARRAGDVVFRPGPERHRDAMGAAGAELLTIELEPEALRGLEAASLPRATLYRSSRRAARLARLARAELRDGQPSSELELLALVYQLLALLARPRGAGATPPEWLARVRARLLDDLGATPTLAQIAADERVPPHRLARGFQRHFGVSVAEFRRRARVERASRLLTESEMPLADVAQAAGFCDQSHLTNVFKRHTGTTPAAFRSRIDGGLP